MTVFAIQRNGTAEVDGINYGSEVDAAQFSNAAPVGRMVDGLTAKFGDAVNDVRYHAAEITTPAVRPSVHQGMKV